MLQGTKTFITSIIFCKIQSTRNVEMQSEIKKEGPGTLGSQVLGKLSYTLLCFSPPDPLPSH